MQTTALLELYRGRTLRLEAVERPGRRGEKSKGIEMGATDRLRLDDAGEFIGREA
jgi:hypothetical protein